MDSQVVMVQMYYTTQDDCKVLKIKPFLPLKVTIFVDIRPRKFTNPTTFCNLYKKFMGRDWLNSCYLVYRNFISNFQTTDRKTMQTAIENAQFQKTILWVDDEEIALEVWSQMLQKLGYKVLQARYGNEALEIFKKRKNSISLVILDMRMPGMNGCEVFDRLKKIQPEVKIILVSGFMEQYDLVEISNRHFDGYIEKPFKLKELSEKIEEVIE